MARISKAQTYAIRWLNQEQKTVENIATELKLTTKQVESVIEKYGPTNSKDKIVTAQKPAVQKMLSAKTANNASVTIMTGEASMNIQSQKNKSSRVTDDCIHRPNG